MTQRDATPLPRYLGWRWLIFLVAIGGLAWLCAPTSRKLARRLLAAGEARQAAVLLKNALDDATDPYTKSEVHEELAAVDMLLGEKDKALANQEKSVDL